jgi:hypothetical protein
MDAMSTNNRTGIHYFPDDQHYSESHIDAWLPEIRALGASWLVLHAHPQRNVPEPFIKALIAAGVTPIVHLQISPITPPTPLEMQAAFQAYAAWGLKYMTLFNEPNQRATWQTGWPQQGLVERFLDFFIPLANEAIDAGLLPGFPALRPGGDYWDTAFLRASLKELKKREANVVLDTMFLSADARTHGHPVQWGAGGPERWAGARPYQTPPNEQDQCGFHIFDWYNAISTASVGKTLPLLLLKAGSDQADDELHQAENLEILRGLNNLPDNVLAINFWLLAANETSADADQAWFQSSRAARSVVAAFKRAKEELDLQPKHAPTQAKDTPAQWADMPIKGERETQVAEQALSSDSETFVEPITPPTNHPDKTLSGSYQIEHYLLLPTYEWGVADWHLEVIQPFVKKHHPTIGFSTDEAACARRVTIVGGVQSFPDGALAKLKERVLDIVQIEGDGTSIASKLASL